jgi:2'-5' RNA ligase
MHGKTVRAFVAVHPDPATTAELQRVLATLRQRLTFQGIRWMRTEQLHLTLQFLGAIPETRLPEFENALAEVCAGEAPCSLRAIGFGCFPNSERPRILWAGVNGDVVRFREMKSALDGKLSALGYVPEKREFHPHITLARIEHLKLREIEELNREVIADEGARFGAWEVEKVDLLRSVLSPTGATYSLLKSFALGH